MAKANRVIEDKSVIYEKPLEQVMHESMIPFSEYVILDRALPRVEDGLKPVQRRILYSMYELGITPDKPYRKCARIVGDCLGKYHPHGDSSVYGALARMAQPYNMRKVLIDGQGNFGSVDGDNPAAMRYTEARLSPLAMELLRDIEKDTVNMQWNFDDTTKEPETLPGRFPNLLVNGADGIAVGLATNIPTHNLNEVIDGTIALIDRPKMKLEELMEIIKAPDFPTGGTLIVGEELKTAYETGKGKVVMRAKIHIEDAENDKKNIVITELPYQVAKAPLLQQILKLSEEKKEILGGISAIIDESDRNGMRAVIKVKKDADAQKIVKYLYKQTRLEINFNINMVAIAEGKPKQMGLIEILTYYIDYQREVIIRRANFDLKAARQRAEIVEGLLIAIRNIDEVIRIIKKSPSVSQASAALRERFGLSERQAQAILEMKLRRLTGLDVEALETELKELKKRIEELVALLASKRLQNNLMKTELTEVKKAHKTPRMSTVQSESGKEIEIEYHSDEVAYKEGVLVLNANGNLKFVQGRGFAQAQRRAADSSGADSVCVQAEYVNNRQKIYAFGSSGNCYKLSIDDLPEKKWREKGASIASLDKDAPADDRIVAVFASENVPLGELLIFTENGMVKRSPWEEYNVAKSCYKAINLTGDKVLSVQTVVPDTRIFTATADGLCLMYGLDEIPVQGRNAGGVKSVKLGDGDKVAAAFQTGDEGEIVVVSDAGYAKRVFAFSFEPSKRYNKGVKIMDLTDKARIAVASYVTVPYDIAVFTEEGVVGVNTEDIRIDSRTGKGKPVAKGVGMKASVHVYEYNKI